ncbi:MAG: 30S ribosomal protein S1 [Nitrospirae bacterium]|nr:MAG: 30S ribosomal protein S1 [Nitrospirota bacterium]
MDTEERIDSHNERLEELISETIPEVSVGSIVMGRVVEIRDDSVVVDIGYKSEGFVPLHEFTEEELSSLQPGDEIEVFVSRLDVEGNVNLSVDRVRRSKLLQKLKSAKESGEPVDVKVIERIKGGYRISLEGILGFMPFSHADLRPLKNPEEIVGQTVRVKVLDYNQKLTNIIVSRKEFLQEERQRLKEKLFQSIEEGSKVKGVVKNITDFGVFIDLGGIDGFMHISDISWGRIKHPSNVFKVGQEIEAVVLKIDRENERISLGYKQRKSDPWLTVEDRYIPGRIVSGKVVSLASYGAFVELEEGVEGLIHISEFEWGRRPKHPSDYVEVGDFVDARVLSVDKKQRRISLSIKQLKPRPWDIVVKKYKEGDRVTGRIKNLTDFGAFVELPEGVEGLLHVSDISWTRHIKHPSETLKKGQQIEVVILKIDPENEKLSLGLKQLQPNPWEKEIPEKYQLGDEVKCKVLRINEYGIFVLIDDLVEGLIYTSEIEPSNKKPDEVYKEGDEIWARIIKIEPERQKIGLSMKNLKSVDYAQE